MPKKIKAKKRPGAQDATRRNVQAANKKLMNHEARIDALEQAVRELMRPSAPSEPLGPDEAPAA